MNKLDILSLTALLSAMAHADAPKAVAHPTEFTFKIEKAGLTSAGIYDADGKLLRVLWTMKPLEAGSHTESWDGLDQLGAEVPAGTYSYRIAVNRATYRNVGAIGNSGKPPNDFGHTPANLESVSVDAEGAVYTANNWDESGADFKKWDASGTPIYGANYQIRNGNPNGAPYSIATDDQYLYCGMGGWANEQWKNRQQVQRFRLKDGKIENFTGTNLMNGHINVYEWPAKQIPEGTPEADAKLMGAPLRALAVSGDTILVADALGGRVLRYHKVTGDAQGEFKVPLAQAIAVDAKGHIWVGHEHHKVSVFQNDGTPVADVLTDLGEVEALAFGPDGLLYVADSGAGQVKVFDVTGDKAKPARTLGQKAVPGDRAPDHFFHLRGVAEDSKGNVVTIQTEPLGGARLARWSPTGKLLWEHFGAEFVSLGNYGTVRPDDFYSMSLHHYRLLDRNAGTWEYAGSAFDGTNAYRSDTHGVPRVLRLGKNDFVFIPTGDGVQVFRVDGKVLRLAALVGGRDPDATGQRGKEKQAQWTWHDAGGTGAPRPQEINWFKKPGEANYAVFGMDVDVQGNIWFGNLATHSIWTVPVGPLDARGNPTYDWAQAREVIARDTSRLGFEPNMAQHAPDGTIYAFGWSKPWPSPKNNPFWMGGTTLVRFDAKGQRMWAVPLEGVCVGLDVLPGGGCIVGKGNGATLYHFSPGGLLIGSMAPGEAMGKQSGWLDNHASVAVNRAPDGLTDIFAEDDYNDRIGWYRADLRQIDGVTGTVQLLY